MKFVSQTQYLDQVATKGMLTVNLILNMWMVGNDHQLSTFFCCRSVPSTSYKAAIPTIFCHINIIFELQNSSLVALSPKLQMLSEVTKFIV